MLALAEGDGFLFGQFELHRGKFRGFMGAITERLIGGQTAFTPPIGSSFEFEYRGRFECNFRFTHFDHLKRTE